MYRSCELSISQVYIGLSRPKKKQTCFPTLSWSGSSQPSQQQQQQQQLNMSLKIIIIYWGYPRSFTVSGWRIPPNDIYIYHICIYHHLRLLSLSHPCFFLTTWTLPRVAWPDHRQTTIDSPPFRAPNMHSSEEQRTGSPKSVPRRPWGKQTRCKPGRSEKKQLPYIWLPSEVYI